MCNCGRNDAEAVVEVGATAIGRTLARFDGMLFPDIAKVAGDTAATDEIGGGKAGEGRLFNEWYKACAEIAVKLSDRADANAAMATRIEWQERDVSIGKYANIGKSISSTNYNDTISLVNDFYRNEPDN